MSARRLPEDVKRKVNEEVKRGRLVIIHPDARRRFKGAKVVTINYPR